MTVFKSFMEDDVFITVNGTGEGLNRKQLVSIGFSDNQMIGITASVTLKRKETLNALIAALQEVKQEWEQST